VVQLAPEEKRPCRSRGRLRAVRSG
jgi:hypothetical protein